MKIDAVIEWVTDDPEIGIESGSTLNVPIDADYVEATETDIAEAVEEYLRREFDYILRYSWSQSDDGDFVITNLRAVIEDIMWTDIDRETK